MYCKNCGVELIENNSLCINCGTSKGLGSNYCSNCGTTTGDSVTICPNCGLNLAPTTSEVTTSSVIDQNNNTNSSYSQNTYTNTTKAPKSKIAAGLLGIFLGWLGVHRLYLGYTAIGVTQLVLGLLGFLTCGITTMISSTWGLIEGILILCNSTITTDSDGNPLGN